MVSGCEDGAWELLNPSGQRIGVRFAGHLNATAALAKWKGTLIALIILTYLIAIPVVAEKATHREFACEWA